MPDKKPGSTPGTLNLSDAERRLLDNASPVDREFRLQDLLNQLTQAPHTKTQLTHSQASHLPLGNTSVASDSTDLERAKINLEIAGLQLDIGARDDAHRHARSTIDTLIEHQSFEDAALACQYIYLSENDDAISAIGQAAWLAVTYPVNPQLTANILDHIIDETPDESDGAAVAAATAHYVADLRCDNSNREQVKLFTGSMLARVARRHSNVEDQDKFERWVRLLELDEPDKFLVRLRNVIDVMVQEDWWFDRDALFSALPAEN